MDPGRKRGFTLLEMLIALGVFAIIGVMSSQILGGIVDLSQTVRDRGDRLAELQRAMFIMGRDMEQLTRRWVRDEQGDPTAAITIGGAALIEFTRRGWQNPLGLPRSELQRIAYRLEEDRLVRVFWPVLDRGPGTEPIAQVLLVGVEQAAFVAYDDDNEEHGYWPLDLPTGEESAVLAAIHLRLAHDTYGQLERLWQVAPPSDFLLEAAPAGGLPGSDEEPES